MGLFDKIKQGLKKTKDSFSEKIAGIMKSFKKIDEAFFDELEETLILSDIGGVTANDICNQLRVALKKANETDVNKAVEILKDIIAKMLSGGNELDLPTKPTVILIIGVNGGGKTTTVGKLSAKFKNEGKKVLVCAADTFRAAAIEQLDTWVERAGVDIIKHAEGSDPSAVVFDSCRAAKARDVDILIIDTAGRLHNKKHLMDELKKIARIVAKELPESTFETLLTLDATTGQNAVNQARLFNEVTEISGIILTKLDGTAKGGIIISIKNELNIPVKFIGVGEKQDDLEPFSPQSFVDAIFEGVNFDEQLTVDN
ncbi:MAG: signal recognition particle-docking protein FtsY [Oscillospiraceae bacterium]|nr:signal recognition particle-docking protein FtsY [Oscillospiraceae bacterium]